MSERIKEFKNPYNLSKDYATLFNLIQQGFQIPCFVNFDWDRKGDFVRDLCICRRYKEYDIQLSARGVGYGGVHPWNKEHWDEKELFLKRCEQLDLEYIEVLLNSQ